MRTRRRRSVAVLALVGVTAVGVGTVANFTDTETVPQNRFTAGTLDLTAGPQSQAWTVDNMAPGDTEYRVITVGNAGTLPLEYDASATLASQVDAAAQTHPGSPANGGLGEALHLAYRGAVVDGASCGPAAASGTETSAFVPSTPQAIDLLSPTRTLAPGVSEQLCFSFQLPLVADNRYQGDSANFTLAFASKQSGRDAANQPVAAAVGNIAATAAAGDASATVAYPAVPGASRYTVRVAPQNGQPAYSVSSAGTSAAIPGLTNGVPYQFVVRAYSDSRVIAQGSTATVTPTAAPTAVRSLTATPSDGRVALSWTAPEGGATATGYRISASPADVADLTVTGTTATVTGLVNERAYTFTVVPLAGALSGPGTPINSTPEAAPAAVTNLAASALDEGQVKVTWTRGSGGTPLDYSATLTPANGSAAIVRTVPAGTTEQSFTGLDTSTTYVASVVARGRTGNSSAATTAAVIPYLAPPAPTGLTIGGTGRSGELRITTAAAGGTRVTALRADLITGGAVVRTVTLPIGGGDTVVTGLTPSATYRVNAYAINAAGTSSSATSSDVSILLKPMTPTNVSVVSGIRSVGVSWSAAATSATTDAATGYTVRLLSGSTIVQTATTSTSSTTFTNVAAGTYAIEVEATNAAGASSVATGSVTVVAYPVQAEDGASSFLRLRETTGAGAQNAAINGVLGTYREVSQGNYYSPDGKAYSPRFNGTTSRVTVPDGTVLTDRFSMEAWIKPDAGQTQKYVFGRSNNNWNVIYGYTAGKVEFYSGDFTGSAPGIGTAMDVPSGVWSHVTYTYDGTTMRGYVNGVQKIAVTTSFRLGSGNGVVTIGGASAGGTDVVAATVFAGGIADVAWGTNPLTAAQVKSHYDAGK